MRALPLLLALTALTWTSASASTPASPPTTPPQMVSAQELFILRLEHDQNVFDKLVTEWKTSFQEMEQEDRYAMLRELATVALQHRDKARLQAALKTQQASVASTPATSATTKPLPQKTPRGRGRE